MEGKSGHEEHFRKLHFKENENSCLARAYVVEAISIM